MQRVSDSTISLGNDYNQPYSSSYSSMTRDKTEYSKPEIVKRSGKSDIFHQMPIAESPRKPIFDRNASTVFSSEPIQAQRPGRKRSSFDLPSDIFYKAMPQDHYEAAPSAEAFYKPSGPSYQSSSRSSYEPSSGLSVNADYGSEIPVVEKRSDYSNALPSLAAFEEQLNVDKVNVRKQLPQQLSHSDIFSDHGEAAPSRGRRHYNSISAPTDIFNVAKSQDMRRSRRDIPLLPDWKAGTSFSNIFGGSVDSLLKDDLSSSRQSRSRVEPTLNSRPSGLSSQDLNRERAPPKGRPTYERSQDQFKSQIWF